MASIKVEQQRQKEELESVAMLGDANSDELERFRNGHGYWYSIIGYCSKHDLANYSIKQAATLGRKATALCKRQGIKPEKINDPRFGKVNT